MVLMGCFLGFLVVFIFLSRSYIKTRHQMLQCVMMKVKNKISVVPKRLCAVNEQCLKK